MVSSKGYGERLTAGNTKLTEGIDDVRARVSSGINPFLCVLCALCGERLPAGNTEKGFGNFLINNCQNLTPP